MFKLYKYLLAWKIQDSSGPTLVNCSVYSRNKNVEEKFWKSIWQFIMANSVFHYCNNPVNNQDCCRLCVWAISEKSPFPISGCGQWTVLL